MLQIWHFLVPCLSSNNLKIKLFLKKVYCNKKLQLLLISAMVFCSILKVLSFLIYKYLRVTKFAYFCELKSIALWELLKSLNVARVTFTEEKTQFIFWGKRREDGDFVLFHVLKEQSFLTLLNDQTPKWKE